MMSILTMRALELLRSSISYPHLRTLADGWIPWHQRWSHPSKESRIQIHLYIFLMYNIYISQSQMKYWHKIEHLYSLIIYPSRFGQTNWHHFRHKMEDNHIEGCMRWHRYSKHLLISHKVSARVLLVQRILKRMFAKR